MDAARAVYMSLGIPYHVGLMFIASAQWSYFIADGGAIIRFFCGLSHSFRMHAFFMIAGLFAALLLQRTAPIDWLKSRMVRLGVPFVSAVLLISPIQMFVYAVLTQGSFDLALSEFMKLLTTPGNQWIEHLWFLPVLIVCCITLTALWMLGIRDKIRQFGDFLSNQTLFPYILFIIIAGVALLERVTSTAILETTNFALITILLKVIRYVALYFTFFMLGTVLGTSSAFLNRFTSFSWSFVAIGAVSFFFYMQTWHIREETSQLINLVAISGTGVAFSQITLVLLKKFLSKPSHVVKKFVDYSFSIYLVHHAYIFVATLALASLPVGNFVKFLLITASVFILSWLTAMLIAASPVTRFLFNGVPFRRAPATA
ncbi:acyltransferase family protein [Yangia sp. PrR004]|nr:acyltransferase family protein [Salipiger sp. PrR004]